MISSKNFSDCVIDAIIDLHFYYLNYKKKAAFKFETKTSRPIDT